MVAGHGLYTIKEGQTPDMPAQMCPAGAASGMNVSSDWGASPEVVKQVLVVENSREQRMRILGGLQEPRLSLSQASDREIVAIEVCMAPVAAIVASVLRYHAWNTTMLVQIDGLKDCAASADELDFSFAKAVALPSSVRLSAGRTPVYQVQIPHELVDSYSAERVLDNVWLQAASSPDHWFKIEPGAHGESFDFVEEVIPRRTEILLDEGLLLIKDTSDNAIEELVQAIMAEAQVAHSIYDF